MVIVVLSALFSDKRKTQNKSPTPTLYQAKSPSPKSKAKNKIDDLFGHQETWMGINDVRRI